MTPRKDDTPEIIFLAFWLCVALALAFWLCTALAVAGWVLEVLHG